jgi:type II secretion system protein G
MNKKRGFTLIELLIVIVIIGILAVIVVGLVATNARNRANDAAAKADMREIQTALELFFADNEAYPALVTDLQPDYMDANLDTADYTYDQDGIDATCYSLTYTLLATTDAQGDPDGDGLYELQCKQ